MITVSYPLPQTNLRHPSQPANFRRIHELAGGAVGLGGVVLYVSGKAHDIPDKLEQIAQEDIRAVGNVDELSDIGGAFVFHEVDAGIREVVGTHEFPARGAVSPHDDVIAVRAHGVQRLFQRGVAGEVHVFIQAPAERTAAQISADGVKAVFMQQPGEVEAAQGHGQEVGRFHVEVVANAVLIGGHDGNKVRAVLLVIAAALFNGRDFGQGIAFVGRLQRGSEQGVFAHGLGREAGVNAGRPHVQKLFYAVLPGRMDDVRADHQVSIDKVRGIAAVRHDAADFRRAEVDLFRLFRCKECFCGGLVDQIQLA